MGKSIRTHSLYIGDIEVATSHAVGIEALFGKRIFLTGATGTVGSFLADMLIFLNKKRDAHIQIVLGGRSIEALRKRFCSEDALVECVEYDMLRPFSIEGEVDFIIHAAGNAHPQAFCDTPVETILGNVDGTKMLLEYCKQHLGTRLLYISSGEVYGVADSSIEEFPESFSGYLDIQSPRSCYPLSKRMAENLCVSYGAEYGVDSVIARLCHTYGPVITDSDSRAHAMFIRKVAENKDIVLKSKGQQVRSYNYIADCASALFTVLVRGEKNAAYNIANKNVVVSIAELAEIASVYGDCKVVFDCPSQDDLKKQSPIPRQVLNVDRLYELGWSDAFDVNTGMEHAITIFRDSCF